MPFPDRDVIILSNKKPTILDNIICPYCGREAEPNDPFTDEHVIGRRFVPKGSLAAGWSLIMKAHQSCNNQKSDLEDDISAITLLPDLGKPHDQPELSALAARKAAGALNRRTKKTHRADQDARQGRQPRREKR